jgi:hypothetical protein
MAINVFQPSNINFDLMQVNEDILKIRDKKARRQRLAKIALKEWTEYINKIKGEAKDLWQTPGIYGRRRIRGIY